MCSPLIKYYRTYLKGNLPFIETITKYQFGFLNYEEEMKKICGCSKKLDNLKDDCQSLVFKVPPEFVIFTRNASRPFSYEGLSFPPEINLLEDRIHPSINDAVA